VERNAISNEMERTIKLLADLQSLRGRVCKHCDSVLCNHEALFSISMGFKDAPLCCSCLAAEFDREPVQMRDDLWSFVLHRPCHRAGWAWANRDEGYEPADLPGCLWPSPGKANERSCETKGAENLLEASESEAWDAGSMACGDLVLELRIRLRNLKPHQILLVTATDSGAREDIPAWCRLTRHMLIKAEHPKYWIERKED
jgi:tRNA 2-thiouridine synthesizing protein A